MSEQTDRMGFPFPSQNKDPYFNDFESMMRALDAAGFAGREDRNIFVVSTATFTYAAFTGLLTWGDEIDIFVATTGRLLVVPAGSVNLLDGQVLWVDLVRGSLSNQTLVAQVSSTIPSSNTALILAFRFGTLVLFRGSRVLLDGESGAVLSVSSLLGGGPTPPVPYGDGSATVLLDAVRISAADTLAKAQASGIATAPAVGFVLSKPTASTAILQNTGELGGFVGLTPGALYYLDQSVAGGITLTPPALPADLGSGKIVQRVGRARNATTLLIQIDPDFLIL